MTAPTVEEVTAALQLALLKALDMGRAVTNTAAGHALLLAAIEEALAPFNQRVLGGRFVARCPPVDLDDPAEARAAEERRFRRVADPIYVVWEEEA